MLPFRLLVVSVGLLASGLGHCDVGGSFECFGISGVSLSS